MASETDSGRFNPFPGLRPFKDRESHLFFGRKAESEQIIAKLLMHRHVTVIGESGTGKSSLIACGIIPDLVGFENDQSWRIISFMPGIDPFRNLSSAIAEQMTPRELAAGNPIPDNPDGIYGMIRDLNITGKDKILIVIDQFEELFRYGSLSARNTASAERFVDSLVRTVNQSTLDIYTIVSMRSEYIGECTRFQGLTGLIDSSICLVPYLSRESYREIIEGPVKYAGAVVDPELVSQLLDEMFNKKDQLPVLQHTLMRTWDCWQQLDEPGRPIGKPDYEAAGTLANAMSGHADEVYLDLDPRGREICEKMFRMITEKGPDDKWLRRPALARDIMSVAGCTADELYGVIEKFRMPSRSFLVPDQNTELTSGSVIDIRHECLVRSWDRLKEWVEAEASSVQMYLKLSEASAMYQQGKTGLLRSPELQLAIEWRNREKPVLGWAGRYEPAFERTMVYLRTSENQYLVDEENRIKLQRQRLRRIGLVSMMLGTAAVIAAAFMIYAFVQKAGSDDRAETAEEARKSGERQRMISDSIRLETENQKNLLDAAATESSKTVEKTIQDLRVTTAMLRSDSLRRAKAETDEAILERDKAMQLRMISVGKSMALRSLQENGKRDLQALLAYQSYLFNRKHKGSPNDADIYAGLYNVARRSGAPGCRSFKAHGGQIMSIAYVPGRSEFYASGSDGQVLKWALDNTEKALQVVYSGVDSKTGAIDVIDVIAISPDAGWLACASSDKSIRMIPLKQATGGYVLKGHTGKIKSLVYSYDGKYLYSAALDGRVLKWDLAARTSTDMNDGSIKITSIDISSKGKYIAGVSSDGSVMVWDPEQRSDNFRINVAGKNLKTVRFNPESNILAIGDDSGDVELWDVVERKKISRVKAHESSVNDIQFNTILKQMATAGSDSTLKIFDVSDPTDLMGVPVTFSEESFITVLKFSSDGQLILTGAYEGPDNLAVRPSHAAYLANDVARLLTRNMTQDEWNMYVARDIPLEQPFPVRDFNIKVSAIQD